jgi:hypothetical protein
MIDDRPVRRSDDSLAGRVEKDVAHFREEFLDLGVDLVSNAANSFPLRPSLARCQDRLRLARR